VLDDIYFQCRDCTVSASAQAATATPYQLRTIPVLTSSLNFQLWSACDWRSEHFLLRRSRSRRSLFTASGPQLNSGQLLIFSIWYFAFASALIPIPFIFQLEHLLEPVRIAQRLQLEMRAEVCAKTLNCAPGQRAESVHGHVLVSQLLCLHDSRQLNVSSGRRTKDETILSAAILANSYLITINDTKTHTTPTHETLNISHVVTQTHNVVLKNVI